MTKDELIALARQGKAHIEVAYYIMRYCPAQRYERSDPVIYLSISNADVHDAAAYLSDGTEDVDLTTDEAEILREAIDAATVRG